MKNILKISAALSVFTCAIITNYAHAQFGPPISGGELNPGVVECKCTNGFLGLGKKCKASGDGHTCRTGSENCTVSNSNC